MYSALYDLPVDLPARKLEVTPRSTFVQLRAKQTLVGRHHPEQQGAVPPSIVWGGRNQPTAVVNDYGKVIGANDIYGGRCCGSSTRKRCNSIFFDESHVAWLATASCRHRKNEFCSSECGQETERSARASLPLNSESRGTLASLSVCIRRQTHFAGTMCGISNDLKWRGAYHTPGRGKRNQYSSCRSCLR
jgi:hypothetical protein